MITSRDLCTNTEKVHVPSVLSLLFCCYGFQFNKTLKLVVKGIKLELWIASLTPWNFITVQRSHGRLIATNITQFLQTSIRRTPAIKQTLGKVLKVSA